MQGLHALLALFAMRRTALPLQFHYKIGTANNRAILARSPTEEKHSKSRWDCGDFSQPVKATFPIRFQSLGFTVGEGRKLRLRYRLWLMKILISNVWPTTCT